MFAIARGASGSKLPPSPLRPPLREGLSPPQPHWEGSNGELHLAPVGVGAILATNRGWVRAETIRAEDLLLGGRTVAHPQPWVGRVVSISKVSHWIYVRRRLGPGPRNHLHTTGHWRAHESITWCRGRGPPHEEPTRGITILVQLEGLQGAIEGGPRTPNGWEVGVSATLQQRPFPEESRALVPRGGPPGQKALTL